MRRKRKQKREEQYLSYSFSRHVFPTRPTFSPPDFFALLFLLLFLLLLLIIVAIASLFLFLIVIFSINRNSNVVRTFALSLKYATTALLKLHTTAIVI